MGSLILISLAAYLIGSIPFGLLLTRAVGMGDIRSIGSGNIGATNVLRTGNKKIAIATLLLDGGKGWLAVALSQIPDTGYAILASLLAGLFALAGHIFPIWLKFKGGKGVATYFGVLLGINPLAFVLCAVNWLTVFYLRRISSLSSLIALGLAPLWLWIFGSPAEGLLGVLCSVLIFYTHRHNIERLRAGTEAPFSRKETA